MAGRQEHSTATIRGTHSNGAGNPINQIGGRFKSAVDVLREGDRRWRTPRDINIDEKRLNRQLADIVAAYEENKLCWKQIGTPTKAKRELENLQRSCRNTLDLAKLVFKGKSLLPAVLRTHENQPIEKILREWGRLIETLEHADGRLDYALELQRKQIRRGSPGGSAIVFLVYSLCGIYLQHTGQMPCASKADGGGPFGRFVKAVLHKADPQTCANTKLASTVEKSVRRWRHTKSLSKPQSMSDSNASAGSD